MILIHKELKIFWNHVGREHSTFSYSPTIQKNSEYIKKQTLEMKLKRCKEDTENQFIQLDQHTLIEISSNHSNEQFIIIYCIKSGLQFSLGHKKKYNWWLIDIVDIEEIEENIFCVHDLFLDISVNYDGSYKVLDMDEFHFAYSNDILSKNQYDKAMQSFITILNRLNDDEFPIEWLNQIVLEYKPQLYQTFQLVQEKLN